MTEKEYLQNLGADFDSKDPNVGKRSNMNREQQALLDVIRAFKPEDMSDLEAALNVIRNYAITITALNGQLRKAQKEIDKVSTLMKELRAAVSPNPPLVGSRDIESCVQTAKGPGARVINPEILDIIDGKAEW